MFSKKRLYAHNSQNNNYNDYNRYKNGTEILKTIKKKDNFAVLEHFKNYQNLQMLNVSYSPFICNNQYETKYVTSLYESNRSFLDNTKYKSNNKLICPCNNNCSSRENYYKLDNICENNTLYPKGKIITQKNIIQHFRSKFDLSKWCDEKPVPFTNKIVREKCYPRNESYCRICINAKPLFI